MGVPLGVSAGKYVILCLIIVTAGFQSEMQAAEIYRDVYTHAEEYEVKKGDRLAVLAQKRALRLQVLAGQNNIKNPQAALKPGTVLNLSHSYILPNEVSHGLVVNLAELAVYHFHQGNFQRRYPLAAGKRNWETPTGNYKILNKIKNPTWRIPESIVEEMGYNSRDYTYEVPPGPDNPLGAYWMATSARGVGLHATTAPWSIGRYVSHGCLRMLPEHIEELFPQVEVGMPIKIIYQPIKVALTADNRVFIQVHGDYYQQVPNKFKEVEALLQKNQLADLVDWSRVKQVVKAQEGIAREVTKPSQPTTVETGISPGLRRQGNEVTKPSQPTTVDTFPGSRLYTGEIIDKPANPPAAVPPRAGDKRKAQPGS